MTYYLAQYNFAVRLHHGAWVLVCRQSDSVVAISAEQIEAIERWAHRNREKYRSLG